ncbi:MAG: ParA family protein [Pseudobdellovibrio sp.]
MKFKHDVYLTPKELAQISGITVQGVHKFFKERKISTIDENGKHHKIYPDKARLFFESRGFKYPKKTISVHNVKGGVGKTTTVFAFSTRLAALGFKVLVVDLDQQGNTTNVLMCKRPQVGAFPTMQDVVAGFFKGNDIRCTDAIITDISQTIHLIPSSLLMTTFDGYLQSKSSLPPQVFNKHINSVRDNYDILIYDCPPSLSRVSGAAHLNSDIILMPIEADEFSVSGLDLNFEHLNVQEQNYGHRLEKKIFINKFDSRPKVYMEIAELLMQSGYRKYLTDAVVRLSSIFTKAAASYTPIWSLGKEGGPASEDYNKLLFEVFDLPENGWGVNKESTQEVSY